MSKEVYALCGVILFASSGLAVSFNGASLAALALLIGGVSQFIAQDDGKYAWLVSNIIAYIAMTCGAFSALGY